MRGYPIGTVRKWKGSDYRKTNKGWVAIPNSDRKEKKLQLLDVQQQNDQFEKDPDTFSGVEDFLNSEHCRDLPKRARQLFSDPEMRHTRIVVNQVDGGVYNVTDDVVFFSTTADTREIVHELAHVYHVKKGIISNDGISKEMQLCTREAHVDVDYYIARNFISKAKKYAQLSDDARKPDGLIARVMLVDTMYELGEHLSDAGGITQDEALVELSVVLDMLAACSKGNTGGGHSKKYWNSATKSAELFAHAVTIDMLDLKTADKMFSNFMGKFRQTFLDKKQSDE